MQGPVVLITGCSTGIGRDLVQRLSAAGCRVVATARRVDTLADLPAALKLTLDVENATEIERVVGDVMAQYGRIDVLVNNAGYGQFGAVEEVSDTQLERVFNVNVYGPVRLARAVLPHMRKQGGGRIINLSSVAGRVAFPAMGVYSATKYAVEALSDAMRLEVAPFGIQVVLIEPGAIRTEFEKTAAGQMPETANQADSPYAQLYKRVQHYFAAAVRSAPGPDVVTRTIQEAIESPRPKARYLVPAGSKLQMALLHFMPSGAQDALMRRLLKG